MKFSLLQENLQTALTHVSRFVSVKAQLPILNNILLATDSGRLKISATNLDLGINYWIGAKIEEEGSVTVPSHEITEFISYLSTGKIDISLNSTLLNIKSQKAESDFAITPSTDFPTINSIDTKNTFEINFSEIMDALNQITFSAATDDSRPVLTGILCNFSPTSLTFVATDGFRLSIKEVKLSSPIKIPNGKENLTFLIPAKTLTEVTKLSKIDSKIKVGVTVDEHQIIFILDDLELISSLLDGQYPEYQKIIPDSFTTTIFVNKDELSQAIKLASVFASQSANVVKFLIKSDSIEISANAPQLGKNKISLDAKINGDPLEIAFNFKFISDFISTTKGKELVIKLNENLTPGLFGDLSDPAFTHIIMPVRIQD